MSLWFRVKERERESETARKMAQVKERGGGGEERKSFLPSPPPLPFFGSRFVSRAAKTENPIPRSFLTPEPNENMENACYAC